MVKVFYSIKQVAEKTGLSTHVLRIWENRYKAVTPVSTVTNRRQYSEDDIERLELLKRATAKGFPISNVVNMPLTELRQIAGEIRPSVFSLTKHNFTVLKEPVPELINQCLEYVRALDERSLENLLNRTAISRSKLSFINNFIIPLINRAGELWQQGELRIYQEHFLSAVLRGFLAGIFDNSFVPASAPLLISTSPAGQFHELGALLISVIASESGFRVIFLGPNLPAVKIIEAVRLHQAKFLALSIIYPAADYLVEKELLTLFRFLPENVTVFAGGQAASSYNNTLIKSGVKLIEELGRFREELTEIYIK